MAIELQHIELANARVQDINVQRVELGMRRGGKNVHYPLEDVLLAFDDDSPIQFDNGDNIIAYQRQERQYTELSRIADYLYSVSYDSIDYNKAKEHFKKDEHVIPAGCSSFRNGNYVGRNLDWLYSNTAEFVITTQATTERKKVKGIAKIDGITKDIAETGKYSGLYTYLPFYLLDGINEDGLYCNVNVVPTDKEEGIKNTIPTDTQTDEVNVRMLVRYILDNFSTADEAIDYLQKHVSIYHSQALIDKGYTTHYMIADSTKTYVLEIIGSELIATETNKMTNFVIDGVQFNADGSVYTNADVPLHIPTVDNKLTPLSAGLERWNIINTNLDNVTSVATARTLLNQLMYSKAYDNSTNPYWFSEFTQDDVITIDTPANNVELLHTISIAQQLYELRDRNNPMIWHTTHSCVYDLVNKTINIVSQEDIEHEYNITF